MRRQSALPIFAWALLALSVAPAQQAFARPAPKLGVVVLAHGAPSEAWNRSIRSLAAEVSDVLRQTRPDAVSTAAFLEFAEPTTAQAIAKLESQGIRHIVVVPAFITLSAHTVLDVPCVLGLLYDPATIKTLKQEKAQFVRTAAQIVVTPALDTSSLLPEIMAERVREISTAPADESVLLVAHGDPGFAASWDALMQSVADKLSNGGGFRSVTRAYIGMGHRLGEGEVARIKGAAQGARRLLVAGVYVASGASEVGGNLAGELGLGIPLVPTSKGLLPHPKIARWIADIAAATAAHRFGDAP